MRAFLLETHILEQMLHLVGFETEGLLDGGVI